jgi:hypothetical protein
MDGDLAQQAGELNVTACLRDQDPEIGSTMIKQEILIL